MVDVIKIKKDFPILSRQINGKRLVYLDNAATSQKPRVVIDALVDYYSNHNANVHRGVHTLSEEASQMYEDARVKIARFINARLPKEVIFTRGTTESINLVANSWGLNNVKSEDEIAYSILEHHSNMIPWQILSQKTGAKIRLLNIDNEGFIQDKDAFNSKTKMVAVSHASNVLGTIQNIKSIAKRAHEAGAMILVDGAQAVPHMKVDVQSLDCDFYVFSGHKMLGPTGIGILYVREEVQDAMVPYQTGGGMIKEVFFDHATYSQAPSRFEAGTPHIAGAIGLGAAIDYLGLVGLSNIRKHEILLSNYAMETLSTIEGLEFYGPTNGEQKSGVFSFVIKGLHPHDIASVLDAKGVAIRSGHHCAMPLHQKFNIPATARASFYLYNDFEDIDALAKGVLKAIRILKGQQ